MSNHKFPTISDYLKTTGLSKQEILRELVAERGDKARTTRNWWFELKFRPFRLRFVTIDSLHLKHGTKK